MIGRIKRRSLGQGGASMIELIIVITVMAAIFATIGTLFLSMTKMHDTLIKLNANYTDTHTLISIMEDDINNAVGIKSSRINGVDSTPSGITTLDVYTRNGECIKWEYRNTWAIELNGYGIAKEDWDVDRWVDATTFTRAVSSGTPVVASTPKSAMPAPNSPFTFVSYSSQSGEWNLGSNFFEPGKTKLNWVTSQPRLEYGVSIYSTRADSGIMSTGTPYSGFTPDNRVKVADLTPDVLTTPTPCW